MRLQGKVKRVMNNHTFVSSDIVEIDFIPVSLLPQLFSSFQVKILRIPGYFIIH